MNGNHPNGKCRRATFIGGIANRASCWVKADTQWLYWPHPVEEAWDLDGDSSITVDVYQKHGIFGAFWYVRTERR